MNSEMNSGGNGEHKAGRPTRKTDKVLQKLDELLRLGLSMAGAARGAGISPSTLYNWIEDDPKVEALVNAAVAAAEEQLVKLALDGAKKDGRIAAIMRSKRFPESWGEHAHLSGRVEHFHVHGMLPAEFLEGMAAARRLRDENQEPAQDDHAAERLLEAGN
ncbi:MAG: hypothetical protein HY674_15540 [Chloroflexi bacterium]|nr:hypothetical protein [Chloroflexota bacterium]